MTTLAHEVTATLTGRMAELGLSTRDVAERADRHTILVAHWLRDGYDLTLWNLEVLAEQMGCRVVVRLEPL